MSSILGSVEWGNPALSLLNQLDNLDPSKPAVMHIRHSAREHKVHRHSTLSKEGKEAAYEFGSIIISNNTRLYYTTIDRTKETAYQIHKAISDKGLQSKIMDIVKVISTIDLDEHNKIMTNIMEEFQITRKITSKEIIQFMNSTDSPIKTYVLRWFSGQYSPLYRRPSLEFVQLLTKIMEKNLKTIKSGGLDIYVSHDTWIAALLFHWFGIIPVQWIRYLDGFIIQLDDTRIHLYLPDEIKLVNYPYWWNGGTPFI
ncbi:MAG: hypothetical protein ACXAEX_22085 [Promethearchaeota archaeon]|jgi:hypothetical protein